MKTGILYSILITILFQTAIFGQITITNATFPADGDVWGVAVDSTAVLTGITAPSSSPLTWDFNTGAGTTSQLENQNQYDEFVKLPSQGTIPDSFPDADIIIPFLGGEGYFKDNGSNMEVIGFYGDPFGFLGTEIVAKMADPIVLYNAPMTYDDKFQDDGSFYVEIDGAIIPPGQFPVSVDSLTISYQTEVNDTVDAYGTLITPTGTYDVLRISRVEYRYVELFAKVPLFGWVDASQYIPELGNDTIWTWIYKDAVTSQNIVEIDLEWRGTTVFSPTNTTTKSARWAITPLSISNYNILQQKAEIKAYPNPAVHFVNFELNQIRPGEYTINLYNVLGSHVKSQTYNLASEATVYLDISELPKGAYVYSIQDEAGKILTTKRLVVTKP